MGEIGKIFLGAIIILSLAICWWNIVDAANLHPEKYYQEQWCVKNDGIMEFVLSDRTRVDCLVDNHAIEFDFGRKWAEAIGQSLYYSLQTGKRAGIVLIMESEKDMKYWIRLNSTIQHFNLSIDTWSVGDGAIK